MTNQRINKRLVTILAIVAGLLVSTNLLPQEPGLLSKVRENDIEAVKALIKAGADVNQEDDMMGYTAMGLTKDIEMMKVLISAGADINHRDKRTGYTHLMLALNNNYLEMAKLLIARGADINLKSNDGATALIVAAGRSKEVVELLLLKGADINVRTKNNLGVFTNCVMGIYVGYVSFDLAELLLEKGADINEKNTNEYVAGETPLFIAAGEDNEELVRFLIKHGANVNAKSNKGKTPLSIATEAGNTNIVEILKAAGAK